MSAERRKKRALVVAGPTCSGKSSLAMDLAERISGTVINADSMQVYAELRILTARPTPQDEARVPHALYGIRPATEAGNVAWWRQAALSAMEVAHEGGRVPILCGGTGLYLASLTEGLAQIPDPGGQARAEARDLLASEGPRRLHARLAAEDPDTAAELRPEDGQRVARAWEVWRGTGIGLSAWRARAATEPVEWDLHAILLDPPRAELREAIARRFSCMLEDGAIDEARALLALGLDPALPAMRAHGVPELAQYLHGKITLKEAHFLAAIATGQYTKRQATWFRHRAIAAEPQTHRFIARYTGAKQHLESMMTQNIPDMCLAG